jgi:hypothetical protein
VWLRGGKVWQISVGLAIEVGRAIYGQERYNGDMTDANRQIVRKSTLCQQGQQDDLRHLSIEERWNMMWPLAIDAWAMRGERVAEQEFQRHVVRIERRGG